MLADLVLFYKQDLEVSSGVVKDITDRVITQPSPSPTYYKRDYKVTSIKCKNYSGDTIQFLPITNIEWDEYYENGETITKLIPVDDNTEEVISGFGEAQYISKIFIKPTDTGSYTSGVTCVVLQD